MLVIILVKGLMERVRSEIPQVMLFTDCPLFCEKKAAENPIMSLEMAKGPVEKGPSAWPAEAEKTTTKMRTEMR